MEDTMKIVSNVTVCENILQDFVCSGQFIGISFCMYLVRAAYLCRQKLVRSGPPKKEDFLSNIGRKIVRFFKWKFGINSDNVHSQGKNHYWIINVEWQTLNSQRLVLNLLTDTHKSVIGDQRH